MYSIAASSFRCSSIFDLQLLSQSLKFRRKPRRLISQLTYNDDDSVEILNPCSVKRRTFSYLTTLSSLLLPLQMHISVQAFGATSAYEDDEECQLVRGEVRKVLTKGKAPGVLRLVFHDAGTYEMDKDLGFFGAFPPRDSPYMILCMVHVQRWIYSGGGMNGSIVYELDRPENGGLQKSVKILQKAKSEVDMIQKVSWADLIAVAGAEAVSICEGPYIPIQFGRIDSTIPDPEDKLPAESFDAPGLMECFQKKGFSAQELVALSGAHTIGSKGFGKPTVFDNSYFTVLLEKPWLSSADMSSMVGLPSDRALVEDQECLRWVSYYANNEDLFFEDFKHAYIKLVNLGAIWRKSI